MGNENRTVIQIPEGIVVSVYKILLLGIILSFSIFFPCNIEAQCLPKKMPLNYGESVFYDIYFKWGILMPRAGSACISFDNSIYKGLSASKYQLVFRTTKFFDAIYKMRDTLDCFYDQNYALLHSSKRVNEGGYYLIDDLTFSYSDGATKVRSHRYTPVVTKIDTVLTVSSGCVSDMLSTTFFLRTLDWDHLKIGENHPFTVAIGRHLVKISFRYQGQAIVEHGDVKYRTHYFLIDIFDEAFERDESAAELWVGDDENHIPIKIRTKLKIGYAEVYYKSSINLKVPLRCRVEIKR